MSLILAMVLLYGLSIWTMAPLRVSPPGQYPLESVREVVWPATELAAPFRPAATMGMNEVAFKDTSAKVACASSPTCAAA